jgi:hypothetical protein
MYLLIFKTEIGWGQGITFKNEEVKVMRSGVFDEAQKRRWATTALRLNFVIIYWDECTWAIF